MKHALKAILFICILLLSLNFLSELFREKKFKNSNQEAVTSWVTGYADLQSNTIDALFLGTSHCFSSVNPMLLWNAYGLATYSLASSAQDIYATKAYLEYGLETQSPKIVLLEVRFAITPDLTAEQWNRRAYDNLPFSISKFENLSYSIRPEESFISYIFPLLRFHERWKELNILDFEYAFGGIDELEYSFKGYYPKFQVVQTDLTHLNDRITDYVLPDRAKNAICEIKKICDNKGIELILWKAPTPMWTASYREAIADLAEDIDVKYIDLNYCLDDLGINPDTDFSDKDSHLNDSGATKVSAYWSEYLKNKLPDHRGDTRYNDYQTNYQYYCAEKLKRTTDLQKYLELITDSQYDLYFCINDGLGDIKSYQEILQILPFENLVKADWVTSYVGVISNGNILEDKLGKEIEISWSGTVNGNYIEILSQGWRVGDNGSIRINGEEYMLPEQRGLGIVVYDTLLNKVIDSVTFDVRLNAQAHRK